MSTILKLELSDYIIWSFLMNINAAKGQLQEPTDRAC